MVKVGRNLMILYNKKIYLANWLTTWSAKWPTNSLRIIIMPFRATNQIKLGWLTNKIYPFYKFLQENGKEIDQLSIIPHDASWSNTGKRDASRSWIASHPPAPPPQITDASSHPWLANITKYSNHAQLIYIVCTGDNYDVIDLFLIVNNVCRSLIRKQCTYIGLIILHWYQWHMGRWMVFYWFWWIT